MTNESQPNTEFPSIAFGTRLQSAREAMRLDIKDAAARLRLNERVIIMMEKERYADDLPITFIRGYIRAYAKLLQIPEHEVKKALEPIQAKPANVEANLIKQASQPTKPVTSKNYSMQISTYFIALTMLGLVGAWWYSHNASKSSNVSFIAENQLLTTPSDTINSTVSPLALNTDPAIAAPNSVVPAAPTPTLANNGNTQVNVNPSSGETTILQAQSDGQTNIVVDKSAVKPENAATSTNNATPAPKAVKAKPKPAPVDEDDEQYNDEEDTD